MTEYELLDSVSSFSEAGMSAYSGDSDHPFRMIPIT